MDISVAIVTANRNHLLKSLLDELAIQIGPQDEVIVLDTANNPDTRNLVQSYPASGFHYHLYAQPAFDFAAARNQLISIASKQGIAFTDDDALPLPNWIACIRSNLQATIASGGATVPAGNFPDWWNYSINWTVGLSPPGTVLGLPGFYPDTCNVSVVADFVKDNAFDTLPAIAENHLYASGREDAEWWKRRRISGDSVDIDYRQIVEHPIHPERVNEEYVMHRARMDGAAFWRRNPCYANATDIPWDLAHIAGVYCDNFFRGKDDNPISDSRIWLHREWGLFQAVWKADRSLRPARVQLLRELAKASLFQSKIRAGRAVFSARNYLTNSGASVTPESLLYVSADCQLGDTVLLRRHINALAADNPDREVIVSSRFPQLLSNLRANVRILKPADELNNLQDSQIAKAIVPYYAYGDIYLWRRRLSKVGATFDCDVGFPGRRDYHYAHKIVPKNLNLHEHENLARLFEASSTAYATPPPRAVYSEIAMERVFNRLKESGIEGAYILVQFGAGYPSKEWPTDKWLPCLETVIRKLAVPIAVIGDAGWRNAGDQLIENLKGFNIPLANLAGETDVEELMALIDNAAMLIGGCSGPKHIAFMMDTPTFSLYGPTEPYRWGATENHHLHAYTWPLGGPLTASELKGLDTHHRINLIQPMALAEQIVHHYNQLKIAAN